MSYLEARDIDAVVRLGEVDVEAIVGPGAKLEVAALVVKGEPGDIDLTRGFEQA